jgi:succinoglycan biosynthesis transport protein ExoP
MTDASYPRPGLPDDELLDVKALLGVFRRRTWTLMSIIALGFAVTVIVSFQMPALYTATSKVALEVRQSQVMDFTAVLSGAPPDSAMVDTEVEVLGSRQLAGVVVDQLGLLNSPEFNSSLMSPTPLGSIRDGIDGLVGMLQPRQAGIQLDSAAVQETQLRDRAVNRLMDRVDIRRSGSSYLIAIQATSATPSLARDIANGFADQYIVGQLEEKFAATQRANAWLNERVEVLRAQVREKEVAVAEFREAAGLLDAQGATLTEQQVSDVNAQLIMQRAALAEAEARLNSVRSQISRGVSAESIAEVLQSPVIRDLRRQQTDINRRRGDLTTRYGPRHPEIVTINREQSDLNLQISHEVDRIVANLDSEASISRERVRSLSGSLAQLRGRLGENYGNVVRLQELQREADASRLLFQSMLARFQETTEQESLTESDARIVSQAMVPFEPSTPNIPLNLALGLMGSIGLGITVIFLMEVLDTRLFSEQDVESKLRVPHIASVPKLQLGLLSALTIGARTPKAYVVKKPLSGFAESIRTIRSAINMAGQDEPAKIIAVTSALPGEGKTTTSICLGRLSAMSEGRILVVDCDLRRRSLTEELASTAKQGWLEVLQGHAELDDVILPDAKTALSVLPVGVSRAKPSGVFSSPEFGAFLDSLRDRFDLVILDCAPVLVVADSAEVAGQADAVVFNTLWGKTRAGVAINALTVLGRARANLVGVVLNGVNLRAQARYGDAAYGAYYQAYKRYYQE